MRSCPPTEKWSAFLDGSLDSTTVDQFSRHLERCGVCCSLLDDLTAGPDSARWADMRAAKSAEADRVQPNFLAKLLRTIRTPSSSSALSLIRLSSLTSDVTPASVPTGHFSPVGYEILGYLGRGGMGVVYKARQISLKRTVALKMLRTEMVADPDHRARLIGEAETIARLQHPNIAQVYEVGESQGIPYISLEYIEGPTLAKASNGKAISPKAAAELIRILARAAHHAHVAGVVHRDLKPGNILLAPVASNVEPNIGACVPKISDFGLAKRLDESGWTQSGQVVGTPYYMAPEQARGASEAVSPLADVYALGAVLYELLIGKPPLVGLTTIDTVVKVLNEEAVRPRKLNQDIPYDLETVCLRCLEKDPRRRYLSAAALADDLDRFLAGEPVYARPLGIPIRAYRWTRRHPAIATLMAATTILATLGFPMVTILWLDARSSGQMAVEAKTRANQAENEAVRARIAIARQSTGLLADRAFSLADSGDISQALHWFLEALKISPTETTTDIALREVLRRNIVNYVSFLPRPIATMDVARVNRCAFSADGSRFATGDHDGNIRVWDSRTGSQVAGPFKHDHTVADISFHPDGQSLLASYGPKPGTRGSDGHCWQWKIDTGERMGQPFRMGGEFRAVAWSRSGDRVAIGGGNEVRVFDAKTRLSIAGPWKMPDEVTTVCFSPDDQALAVAFGRVYVVNSWKHEGGCRFIHLKDGNISALADFSDIRPEKIVFSPAGDLVAIGSKIDGTMIQRIDPVSKKLLGKRTRFSSFGLGGITPDGTTVLLSSLDRSVRFGDIPSGNIGISHRTTWTNHVVEIDPTGSLYLKDTELWAMPRPTSRPISANPILKRLAGIPLFLNDSHEIVRLGHDKTAYFTSTRDDMPTRHPIHNVGGPIFSDAQGSKLALSRTGMQPRGEIRLFDLTRELSEIANMSYPDQLGGIAFSNDGSEMSVGTYGTMVYRHDLVKRTRLSPIHIGDIVLSLAYSPDGRKLAVSRTNDWSKRPWVRFFDTATGEPDGEPLPHIEDGVKYIQFNKDGSRLFAGSDARVRLWDVESREPVGSTIAVAGLFRGSPFSPDGNLVACLESNESIRIRDSKTGDTIGPPVGGPSKIVAASFSPDSRSIAIGHIDGSTRVWDLVTMRPVGPSITQRFSITGVSWEADGSALLTIASSGVARRWSFIRLPEENLPALELAIEIVTAARMDAGLAVVPLSHPEWQERYRTFGQAYSSFEEIFGPLPDSSSWHDSRARDAEEEGVSTTAIYHLDQVIRLRPKDQNALLRRMHQKLLLEDYDGASDDYRLAEDISSKRELSVWCHHQEMMSFFREHAGASCWYAAKNIDFRNQQK